MTMYNFAYGDDTPYARAVSLVQHHRSRAGDVVIDLGCGYGAIAEPISSLGLTYLGVDVETSGVKALEARGMEVLVGDLTEPEVLLSELDRKLDGRRVAAICMLDVVEHLAEPGPVLDSVRQFALSVEGPPLVVSIPNVTHLDLGVKLLMGRWDVTPTGLLDSTHLRFFSESLLGETMRGAGWMEVGVADFELSFSDQHFPSGAVALERGTPIGALLSGLREGAPAPFVNQFVRAYLPVLTQTVSDSARTSESAPEVQAPFLSVLMRTRGTRLSTLGEALLSLAAQTCDDFEVLLIAHDPTPGAVKQVEEVVGEFHPEFASRVRVVVVRGGSRSRPLNEGARLARGRYLTVLDDDDVALAHWVETFKEMGARAPGRVLRAGAVQQVIVERPGAWDGADGYDVLSKPAREYALDFDFLEHLEDNRTPSCGYAVPRSLVCDLGHRWDESLSVLEDWEFLLRAASLCGVEGVHTIASLVRIWQGGERSTTLHDEEEWEAARAEVIAKVDSMPLLLSRNSMTRLVGLLRSEKSLTAENLGLGEALDATRRELTDVRESTSWKMTEVARVATGGARKLLRRLKPDSG